MKCGTCGKNAEILVEYTQIGFCRKCYELLLFRRLKRWFRNNNVIDRGKVHLLLDDGSTGFLLLKKLFQKEFSYPGLRWRVVKRVTSRMKGKIIILPTTLTQESDRFLNAVLKNGDYSFVSGANVFNPLTCLLETDLLKWRRTGKPVKRFVKVHDFVEEVVKRRPMARFSISRHLQEF